MTAAEREAAVEALRCAADLSIAGTSTGFSYAMCEVGVGVNDPDDGDESTSTGTYRVASDAWYAAYRALPGGYAAYRALPGGFVWVSLEAAALLEDGWNPGDPVYRIEDRLG